LSLDGRIPNYRSTWSTVAERISYLTGEYVEFIEYNTMVKSDKLNS